MCEALISTLCRILMCSRRVLGRRRMQLQTMKGTPPHRNCVGTASPLNLLPLPWWSVSTVHCITVCCDHFVRSLSMLPRQCVRPAVVSSQSRGLHPTLLGTGARRMSNANKLIALVSWMSQICFSNRHVFSVLFFLRSLVVCMHVCVRVYAAMKKRRLATL